MNKNQSNVISLEELDQVYPAPKLGRPRAVPKVWKQAAGMLRGSKKLEGLPYQRAVRKEWDGRVARELRRRGH